MADILKKEQAQETDDSLQLKKIIASEKEFNEGWKQYSKATRSVIEETTFQRIKNRKKVNGLAKEDNLHGKKAGLRFAQCNKRKRLYKRITNKSNASVTTSGKKIHKIFSIGKGMSEAKPGKNADLNIERIRKALNEEEKNIDSLNKLIDALKINYDSVLTNVSLNAGQMAKPLDSIHKLFIVRIYNRAALLDDMKKPVVDLKKKIMEMEKFYSEQMSNVVLNPADTGNMFFIEVNRLIKLRQQKQEKCVKQMRDLVKNGDETPVSFMMYKTSAANMIEQDICWYMGSAYSSELTQRGLRFTTIKEKQAGYLLRTEVRVERMRGHYVDLELNRRYIRLNRIAKNNIRYVRFRLKELKKVKREVQKRIKAKLKIK